MIRILCVDDHPIVRSGLVQLAGSELGFEVIGETDNGETAIRLSAELAPHLVVMDMRLKGLIDGCRATQEICALRNAPRVLILSSYGGDESIHRALASGAAGYVLKEFAREELIAAMHAVAAGRRFLSKDVAYRLARFGPRVGLTARELTVLRALGEGVRNREIADRLCISEATARTHVQNILEKFGSHDRGQAVALAIARGFLTESDLVGGDT
jgi:DNA-binding NarL/FixJ family response regulator